MAAQLMATNCHVRAARQPVDRTRQQLLAGTAVTEKQNGRVCRRHFLDRAADRAHGIAHSDDAVQRHRARTLAQAPVLFLELANPERASHNDGEHATVQRLVIKIRGTETDGRHRELAGIVLGHGDDLGIGREIQDLAQQAQALLCERRLAGGAQVEEHDIGLEATDEDQGLFGGLGRCDVEIGEDLLELLPQAAIVLQNEKLAALHLRRRHQLLCHSLLLVPWACTDLRSGTLH